MHKIFANTFICLFVALVWVSPALADQFTVNNSQCCFRFGERLFNDGGTGGQYIFSHTFASDVTLESISLPLVLTLSGNQTIDVEIRTGAVNGSTRGTLVYTSNGQTTASPSIGISGSDSGDIVDNLKNHQVITFPAGTDLTGGTEYFFIVRGSGSNTNLTGFWAASPFSGSPSSKRIYWLSDWTTTTWQNSVNWGAMGASMLFTYSASGGSGGATIIPIEKNMNATTTCLTTASGTSCVTSGYDYTLLIGLAILVSIAVTFLIFKFTLK